MVVSAFAVLLSLLPKAFIPSSICPLKDSEPDLGIVLILSLVAASIRPVVSTNAVDLTPLPLAPELSFVHTYVQAWSVDAVVGPASHILRAVGPSVDSDTVLVTSLELPFVAAPLLILPCFNAEPVLLIFEPLATIARLLPTFGQVGIDTEAMSNAVSPFTTVGVAITMGESPLSLGSVHVPFTLVDRTIWPMVNPETMPRVSQPFTPVRSIVLESVRWSVLYFRWIGVGQRL
mmetsp:Transcript_87388/g.182871  ORF Transcript_87388/g.182871 Transcript_87388/m.182871 type:complete len:233 (-) Transcript_87388:303-1001(-)